MATLGTGTTITFGTSSFTGNIINQVVGNSQSRNSIDASHMGTTGALAFIPASLYDGGEVSYDIEFDGTQDPPIDTADTAETITIDWSGAGVTSAFSGFLTNFEVTSPFEERMTATITVKVTGVITRDLTPGP